LSRATGGGDLAGRQTTNVQSSIGSGESGKGTRSGGASGAGSRPYEEIELVFQKNKGRIFSLYNRALRSDPSLQGKVVVELTISPDGKVTKCRIVSSELNNPELENQLISRIKLFQFQPRNNVDTLVVKYPIDFLPS
jgi:TonB family protein